MKSFKKITLISDSDIKVFVRCCRVFDNYYQILAILTALSTVSLIVGLAIPYIYGSFIAAIYTKNVDRVILLIAVVGGASIVSTVIEVGVTLVSTNIQNKMNKTLTLELYKKLLQTPAGKIESGDVSKYNSVIFNDASQIVAFLSSRVSTFVTNILSILFISIIIFMSCPYMAIVVALFFPISHKLFKRYGTLLRVSNYELKKQRDTNSYLLYQTIIGFLEIKSYGMQMKMENHFQNEVDLYAVKVKKMTRQGLMAQFLTASLSTLQDLVIIILGVYFVLKSILSVELFISFTSYTKRLSKSISQICSMNAEIQSVMVSFYRVYEILEQENQEELLQGESFDNYFKEPITINNVNFGYTNNNNILDNICFKVLPNKINIIIGKSGCGKSTILKLLLKIYEPSAGEIHFGNIEIRNIPEIELLGRVAFIGQNPVFFNMTIKENLMMAMGDENEAELVNSCKRAYIHEEIQKMPKKYDTLLGYGGVELSVGQRQRLALARALISKPQIFIFDEITSSLDVFSKSIINNLINEVMKEQTVLLVTHDLESITDSTNLIQIG